MSIELDKRDTCQGKLVILMVLLEKEENSDPGCSCGKEGLVYIVFFLWRGSLNDTYS